MSGPAIGALWAVCTIAVIVGGAWLAAHTSDPEPELQAQPQPERALCRATVCDRFGFATTYVWADTEDELTSGILHALQIEGQIALDRERAGRKVQ